MTAKIGPNIIEVMSLWNKILIGLILATLPVLFYMSARMLKTEQHWSRLAKQHKAAISKLQEQCRVLQEGAEIGGKLQPGIDQVRAELKKLTVDRQRVWYNCKPSVNVNRQTGAITITVIPDLPEGANLIEHTIVYAFEEAPANQGGRYVGEFKVRLVDGKQAVLEPAQKLLSSDLEKLATSKGPWVIYDSLPHDGHDYAFLFDAYRSRITELVDLQESAKRDLQLLNETLADAQKQVKFYQGQVTVFQAIAASFIQQRDVVDNYLDRLQKSYKAAKAAAANITKTNRTMAGQLAKIQLFATRRIDQRTTAMAQSDSGEY
ncbi:MAG: hypothetical protein ACWGMZ_06610 [Thermoguttaceae bacterium]